MLQMLYSVERGGRSGRENQQGTSHSLIKNAVIPQTLIAWNCGLISEQRIGEAGRCCGLSGDTIQEIVSWN
jgi:hypothetical protein